MLVAVAPWKLTIYQEGVVQTIALHHEAWAGFLEQLPGEGCGWAVKERKHSQNHPNGQHQHIQPESKAHEVECQRHVRPCTEHSMYS